MIEGRKQKKAIQAVQDLIIEARNLSYQNNLCKDLAEFLDGVEYFPALIVEETDNTGLFEKSLKEFCISNNCMNVLNRYESR
jgi:hypothetical protein